MSAASPSPSPVRELCLVGLVAVVVAGGLLWPLPLHLTDALVTSPMAEGPEHVWRWWVAREVGVPWGGFFSGVNHPEGLSVHVVDPLHALVAHSFGWWWGGPSAGLAVVQVFGLVVGALAGHQLAAESGADHGGRWLGAAVGVSVPTIVASGLDGITEGLGLGWVGLQLAMLLRLIRTQDRRDVGLLAAALAGAAWSGPYNAVFAALVDVPVALWALRRTRLPVAGGLLGLLLSSPVVWSAFTLTAHGPGGRGRVEAERPLPTEMWRGAWREGADLVDLLVPAWMTGHAAPAPTTAYLGVVLLGLVVAGAVRSRRQVAWRPWLVGGVLFAMVALGPFLVWEGHVVTVGTAELRPPAALLEELPVVGRLARWYRAGAVAVLLLVPVAAHAVRGLRRRWVVLACVAVLVDARLGSPAAFPGPVTPLASGDWDSVEGPLAEVPSVHPLGVEGRIADRNLLLQTVHGQANSGIIDARGGTATDHPGLRRLTRVLRAVPPDGPERVADAVALLKADGFRGVVIYTHHVSPGGIELLERTLGAPRKVEADVWVFRLP